MSDDILDDDFLDDDGDFLDGDDESLEDDSGEELGIDYLDSNREVQAREYRKDRASTGMSGGQELSSALRLGGVRLRDASGEGIRENPSDTKLLRGGEVARVEIYFKNGRKLIITE